jgi:histidinol-phosphate phosphatase family protein
MSRRPYVILDRDGTVIAERNYLTDPAQVELLPGAVQGMRQLLDLGLGLVILTNQSGIGRKFFDAKQLQLIHDRLLGLLRDDGIEIDGIYHCPHVPEEDCDCRKPRTGLLNLVASDLGYKPDVPFVIGDKPCDIDLGEAVGATTFLVRTGYGATFAADPAIGADHIVDDLAEAATIIERLLASRTGPAAAQQESSDT